MFITDDVGRVRRLTIENPARKNAIPASGWPLLAAELAAFEQSDQRVLVITGAGDEFCSGADLTGEATAGANSADRHRMMLEVDRAARALGGLSKPTVAAVDGVAVGAGMNLAIGCDVTICTARARFSEIFVRRGLTVDFGGTWHLPRRVGLAVASELALTGRMVEGEEALRLGLVSRVVDAAQLQETALELAEELAAGAPLAQRFIKEGLRRSFGWSLDEALAYEAQTQALCLTSDDVIEGVTAFMEQRPPDFRGR